MDEQLVTAALSSQPHFTIEKLERGEGLWHWGEVVRLVGAATENLPPVDQSVCLYFADNAFATGVLLASHDDARYRTIQVSLNEFERYSNQLNAGCTVAIFAYDRRRLDLVIGPDIAWQKVTFTPFASMVQRIVGTDGKPYRQMTPYLEGDPVPPGASIEEFGWDHEHCVFCWGKIDSEHEGYNSKLDNQGEWVCVSCFQKSVAKHDLRALWMPPDAIS